MVTLTGTFTRLDGTPATGTVRVTPSRSPIMDPDGKIVISGPQTFPLDKDGKLSVPVPASNDPDLGPPFTYTVEALLSHKPWKISKVWIPHGSSTVDLSEIGDYQPVPGEPTRTVTIPADGTDGQVLVWDGAGFSWEDSPPGLQGPEGPRGLQGPRGLTGPQGPAIDINTGLPIQVDTTVGTRIFIGGHMVYGDTGWRTLTSWDSAGTVTGEPLASGLEPIAGTSGAIAFRRLGPEVMLTIYRARFTSGAFIPIPVGFRPGGSGEYANLSRVPLNATVMLRGRAGNQSFFVEAETTPADGENSYRAMFRYITSTNWPTALPGLPG